MDKIEKQLKKLDKYFLFINYKNKFKSVGNDNNKSNLIKNFKNKYLKKINKDKYDKTSLILIKISKVKYNPNSKIKLIAGPVKINISFYYLSNRGAIKTNSKEKRNNHLFYTLEFLEKNKISKKHFLKIVTMAYTDKLEKRTLAPKTIEQIFKN